jgi:hypothetical protein
MLEHVRDNWSDIYTDDKHFPDYARKGTYEECCLLNGDFQILELSINQGVYALERQLDSMRFT